MQESTELFCLETVFFLLSLLFRVFPNFVCLFCLCVCYKLAVSYIVQSRSWRFDSLREKERGRERMFPWKDDKIIGGCSSHESVIDSRYNRRERSTKKETAAGGRSRVRREWKIVLAVSDDISRDFEELHWWHMWSVVTRRMSRWWSLWYSTTKAKLDWLLQQVICRSVVETGLILFLNAQVHNKLRTGETSSRNSEKVKSRIVYSPSSVISWSLQLYYSSQDFS